MGRGELSAFWNVNPDNTVGLTLRSALGPSGRGSARLEWLQTLGTGLGGGKSNLRLHTQLFSGYGDSLIDYNRKRTVFSVGLSLVDF
jgi:phospholipase A1